MLAIAAAGVAQDKWAVVTPRDHRARPASGRAVKSRDSGAGLPALGETCKGESSMNIRLFCVHRPAIAAAWWSSSDSTWQPSRGIFAHPATMAFRSCLLIMSCRASASSCRFGQFHEGKRNRLLLRRPQARIAGPALRIGRRSIWPKRERCHIATPHADQNASRAQLIEVPSSPELPAGLAKRRDSFEHLVNYTTIHPFIC